MIESWLILLVLAYVVGLPVLVIYLWISHRNLSRTVAKLAAGFPAGKVARSPDPAPIADEAAPETAPESAPESAAVPAKSQADPAQVAASAAPPDPDTPAPQTARRPSSPAAPPRAIVFTAARTAALSAWFRENWFYVLAAISLALAGVFFVQYGIENGILSPFWRVMAALVLGLCLIGAGEWVRRRGGDEGTELTALLPSTLSGSGLVSIFAAIVAARQLYGLIGPEVAFAGMLITSLCAVGLGWFYGAFLTAFGILGAVAAPFLVGGSSNDPFALVYYFALIAMAGLLVDAVKRSAWISVLAIGAPMAGAALLMMGTGIAGGHFAAFAGLMVAAATLIPVQSHDGPMVIGALMQPQTKTWPEFPTRLVAGTLGLAVPMLFLAADGPVPDFWAALSVAAIIAGCLIFWSRTAPALGDLALLAVAAVVGLIAWAGFAGQPVAVQFVDYVAPPETGPPMTLLYLVVLGAALTAILAWRERLPSRMPLIWATVAAATAPLTFAALDAFWSPLSQLSPPSWGLHAGGIAGLLTFLAMRAPRGPQSGFAFYVLGAVVMLTFAAAILLTKTALTIAFAVATLAAVLLDRRFDITLLSRAAVIGGMICSYRLVIDPGLAWALSVGWAELLLGNVAVLALLFAASHIMAGLGPDRFRPRAVLEGGTWTLLTITICIVLYRQIDTTTFTTSHWALSLFGMIWIVTALNQHFRATLVPEFSGWFGFLASASGVIGMGYFAFGIATALPVVDRFLGIVFGPPVFDTLFVAYGLPAVLFALAAWKLPWIAPRIRRAFPWIAAGFACLYVGMEIRRLWHGAVLSKPEIFDGELYSYSMALIAVSVILLLIALKRRSDFLRRIAVVISGIAVAKVFFVDVSGLVGLYRVFSFLFLGLALAGLALINRWMSAALAGDAAETAEDSEA